MAFKRKRVFAPRSNAFKKRKGGRRKRMGRKRITDFTSLAQRGTSIGFRGKKTSRKAYKSWLWNSTLFKTHYRSLESISGTTTTPANNTDLTLSGINLYRNGLGTKFWTAGGGLVEVDIGVTPPLFASDIILRGGVWTVTFHNTSLTDIQITIWDAFTVPDPAFSLLPASAVKGWDPSVSGDFSTLIAKTKSNRTLNLEAGNSYTMSGRFRTQKIDQAVYELDGKSPWLFWGIGNVGTSTIANVNFVRTHNLSFSADAIGTT